jgi:hypothetical protein
MRNLIQGTAATTTTVLEEELPGALGGAGMFRKEGF